MHEKTFRFMEPQNPYAPPKALIGQLPAVPGDLVLATRWQRFCGAFADGLALAVPMVAIIFIFFGSWSSYSVKTTQTGGFFVMLSMGGVQLLAWLLLNGYLIKTRGQTIGKLAVGTRIVRRDGSPVTLGRVFGLRYLPLALCSLIPFVNMILPLIDSLMIFRKSRACIHDDIADTMVVLAN